MARQPRLDLPGIAQHVVQRGNDRQACFAADTDYLRYLQEDQSPTGIKFKGLDFRGYVWATKHWGLTLYGVRDIDEGAWRRRDVGVVYRDDCVQLEVVYRRDQTFNRTLGPSNSVVLRLTLATLGVSGYRP